MSFKSSRTLESFDANKRNLVTDRELYFKFHAGVQAIASVPGVLASVRTYRLYKSDIKQSRERFFQVAQKIGQSRANMIFFGVGQDAVLITFKELNKTLIQGRLKIPSV